MLETVMTGWAGPSALVIGSWTGRGSKEEAEGVGAVEAGVGAVEAVGAGVVVIEAVVGVGGNVEAASAKRSASSSALDLLIVPITSPRR